jgi:hypothetical protein
MIFIVHRINTLKKLRNISPEYGVEIDVRSYQSNLTLNHEPFQKKILLNDYLKEFKHKFVIFNIKEEGIELKTLKILNKHQIKNYFFLDVNIPTIIDLLKKNININLCLRLSRYEDIKNVDFFKKKVKWIWIDTFNDEISLSINNLKHLSKIFNLCLVSPELVKNNKIDLDKFIKINKKKTIHFKAICTKKPLKWKSYMTDE